MKLFGKNKETLRIKKVAATRAIYQGPDTTQTEIEIKLKTEDGEKLTLLMPLEQARFFIRDVQSAYTAAAPPLFTGTYESQWQGMDDNS